MAEEPADNIGGAFGRDAPGEPSTDPATRAEAVVDRLGDLYWRKTYGDRDAFGCLVRTILSQNTSDVASQPAFDALIEGFGESELAPALARAPHAAIVDAIRPAGLYNQKSEVLQAAAQRVLDEWGGAAAFDRYVAEKPPAEVRETLLSFAGVGPKTADCVLLFAGGRPGVFPVDTHVHRIYRRLGIAPPDADHETVRAILEASVPPEKCGFGHTATIQFGREYCTARRPCCLDGPDACPVGDLCERVGVDPATDAVVDPADTAGDRV